MESPIIDLALCESRVLLLHPGKLYRFTPHNNCSKCMTLAKHHEIATGTEVKVLDTSEPKEEFAYSYDQEEYWGSFATRGDAVAECMSEADLDTGFTQTVWTGRVCHATSYLNDTMAAYLGDHTMELIDEWLNEEVASDDTIVALSPEKKMSLGLLILDYVKNNGLFNRWGVDQIEEHTGVKE